MHDLVIRVATSQHATVHRLESGMGEGASAQSSWHGPALGLVRALPRNAISRLMGRIAAGRLPRSLRAPVLGAFGRAVGVNFDEVRDPIDSFDSLQAFFTRALAAGARPVDPQPDSLVAPCDGVWGESGMVEDGMLMQLKGRPYSLAALLGDEALAQRYEGGAFATFYLAPRDYHRFHTPCAVRVTGATLIPGTLWPVNQLGVRGIDGLFAENERICAHLTIAADAASGVPQALCLVAVGATMVGRIRLTFDAMTTNVPGASLRQRDYPDGGIALAKGQEWGHFEFGSTIVMLAEPGLLTLDAAPPGTPLRQGTRIGRLLGSPPAA
jgi:phosphatidylserine decarboxylase